MLTPPTRAVADVSAAEIARYFPATELAHIGDEVSDGFWSAPPGAVRPLALFDALRTDFSLARITHYTGAPAEHAQAYLLFTNYHRYVDEFVRFACQQLQQDDSPYEALSCAGGLVMTRETADPERAVADGAWRRHQMPAYHLMAQGRRGLSLINIGVGPSNAKTITAASNDTTACHSMLWLTGCWNSWRSVVRWWLVRCSGSELDDMGGSFQGATIAQAGT